MDVSVKKAVMSLAESVCLRYRVKYMSSMMAMAALEAIMPNTPEHTKAIVVNQLQQLQNTIGQHEFYELVKQAKASYWVSDEDLIEATKREEIRQLALSAQENTDRPPISSAVSSLGDLKQELVNKEAKIREQEMTIAELTRERDDALNGAGSQLAQLTANATATSPSLQQKAREQPGWQPTALLEEKLRRTEEQLRQAQLKIAEYEHFVQSQGQGLAMGGMSDMGMMTRASYLPTAQPGPAINLTSTMAARKAESNPSPAANNDFLMPKSQDDTVKMNSFIDNKLDTTNIPARQSAVGHMLGLQRRSTLGSFDSIKRTQ